MIIASPEASGRSLVLPGGHPLSPLLNPYLLDLDQQSRDLSSSDRSSGAASSNSCKCNEIKPGRKANHSNPHTALYQKIYHRNALKSCKCVDGQDWIILIILIIVKQARKARRCNSYLQI